MLSDPFLQPGAEKLGHAREVLAPSTTLCCFTASKCLGGFCSLYRKRGSKTKVSELFTAFRGKAGEGFVTDLKASET